MGVEYIKHCIETDIKANPDYDVRDDLGLILVTFLREPRADFNRFIDELESLAGEETGGKVDLTGIRECQEDIRNMTKEELELVKGYIAEMLGYTA